MNSAANPVKGRELERQLLQVRVQRALLRYLPEQLPDYLNMLIGTLIVFGAASFLLQRFTSFNPLWMLVGLALVYSLRSAYYKVRITADPGYAIPKCGCAGAVNDRTEVVLRSAHSDFLGVPNGALAALLYVALLVAVRFDFQNAALALAVAAVVASAYLGYVMVVRIGALCPTCVTIAGLDLLIVWQLLG
jgi:uncharacterized membrane protein